MAAPALVYLPNTASPAKVGKLRALKADLVSFGEDCVDAEVEARRVADEQGMVYVSPYNDWEIMSGQGTVSCELLQQLPSAAAAVREDGGGAAAVENDGGGVVVLVPVGGGGLIAGMAAVLKERWPKCEVIGCQPVNSPVMAESVAAGKLLDMTTLETLSDGTAGGIEAGALTFEPCQHLVDSWIAVTEQEIADAVVSMLHHHSKLVEGAAGCAVAAVRKLGQEGQQQLEGKQVVVVCCGGNVAVPTLRKVLDMGVVWS